MDLRETLQATLGSTYTLERELEGGGMSRVFVATETALGRQVVVKVLPPEAAAQVSLERFKREIMLAARLQHPHIVPLLSAGATQGLPYFTMPFVEGESLRTRLARHGELPVSEAVRILREIASALAYAHGRGIVHRDIKPDNVLLSGSSAMVTDFGVAKALSASSNAEAGKVTSVGIAVGTPAYMSPEQATADPAIDHRADIYAFGVLAYELLTGQPPFAGRTPQTLLAAHVGEFPEPIHKRRSSLPRALSALVMRCLEKRPADRPQSAAEIVHALDDITMPSGGMQPTTAEPATDTVPRVVRGRWIAVAAVAVLALALASWWRLRAPAPSKSDVRALAVLPFENIGGDTTFDYLADGISDELRSELTRGFPELSVKARSSSERFRGSHIDVHEVGAKLAVGVVLEGTVRRSGARLHVTTDLVNVADENALWSAAFDRPLNDLVGLQDSVTRAVSGALRARLAVARPETSAARPKGGTRDFAAYDLFLRGRHAYTHFDFRRASGLFREAVARDPGFARAHAYLALAYADMPTVGVGSLDSAVALAQESAQRALALDSTVAEGYAAQSIILSDQMRLAEALKPLEKAVAIDSSNAEVVASYGLALSQVGRVREALVQARRAHEQDPLSVTALGLMAYFLLQTQQYREAIAENKAALDLDPRAVIVHVALGFAYAFSGLPDSAVAAFETAVKLNPKLFGGRSNLVFGYAVAGRWTDVARQRALIEEEGSGNSPNYYQMIVDLSYGKYDAAMTALERGIANREPLYGVFSIPCDPLYDPLKSNPRFAALMQRLGARVCPPTGKWPVTSRPH